MKRAVRIGITLGDVNGIGPEIALKAARRLSRSGDAQLALIGSRNVLAQQARRLRLPLPPPGRPAEPTRSSTFVWDPAPGLAPAWRPGRVTADASRAAAAWIHFAVEACLDGQLDGMVTAPICKEGLKAAGLKVPGHTEMLAQLCDTDRFAMMLFGGPLRVILATRHVPSPVSTTPTRASCWRPSNSPARPAMARLPQRAHRRLRLNPHAATAARWAMKSNASSSCHRRRAPQGFRVSARFRGCDFPPGGARTARCRRGNVSRSEQR